MSGGKICMTDSVGRMLSLSPMAASSVCFMGTGRIILPSAII